MIYEYDYSVYFRQNCAVPLLIGLTSAVALIVYLISEWKNRRENHLEDWLGRILIIGIFLFFAINNMNHALSGGIYLLTEKPADQITVTGIVEATYELPSVWGLKYGTENNRGDGEAIRVNGEKYYLTSYFDIVPGDEVEISVLPKSGFVMRMEKLEKP